MDVDIRSTHRHRIAAAVLILLMSSVCAPAVVAAAADRPPDPAPLWDAYPLAERAAGGAEAAGAAPAGPSRAGAAPARPSRGGVPDPPASGPSERPAPPAVPDPTPPLAATDRGDHDRVALAALIGLASALVVTGAFALLRRRAGARPRPDAVDAPAHPVPAAAGMQPGPARPAALPTLPAPSGGPVPPGPPPADTAPETCRIVWRHADGKGHFRALAINPRGRRYVAGRSALVPWDADVPPQRGAEPLAAFEVLVRRLEARGWAPATGVGDGVPAPLEPAWYARSFRRVRRPQPSRRRAKAGVR
jgi:hypothetical protein